MTTTSPTPRTTQIDAGDALLHVEVRGEGPAVMLFGCPMRADAFGPLADQLALGHTVITTDPRGIGASTVADRDRDVSPETLAADLVRIVDHLDIDRVSVFGSSGGAVAALAVAITHPSRVGTIVAHEPPLEELLEDRAELRADTEGMVSTYLAGDLVGAWEKFMAGADISMPDGAIAEWINGRSDPQELADEHFFFAHTLRQSTWWLPDIDALRDGPTRIIVGVGSDSVGQVCDRTSAAVATALDLERTVFPGDHTGFVEHPEEFAAQLSAILENP